jgi:hypothetical protein
VGFNPPTQADNHSLVAVRPQLAAQEAPHYFGWMAHLATIDLAASGTLTRQRLGWTPTGPDLLTDLRNMDYAVA